MDVAIMGERRGECRFSWESVRERYHLDEKGVNGK